MAIPSRQIGQSTQANLLWQISKQLERLTCVTACGCGTTTTTTTIPPTTTTTTTSSSTSTTTSTSTSSTTTTTTTLPINNPQAYAYAEQVIAAGGTIDTPTALALDKLFEDLQSTEVSYAAGIYLYDVLEGFYPMLGTTAATQAINANGNTAYDLQFSGGWTFGSLGMQGNGINTVAYTGKDYVPIIGDELYNTHFSIYGTVPGNSSSNGDLSVSDSNDRKVTITLNSISGGGLYEYDCGSGIIASTPSSGDFAIISTDGSSTYAYQNGGAASPGTAGTVSPLIYQSSLYLGSAFNVGFCGLSAGTSVNTFGWSSFGGFMDTGDMGNYQALVNAFMTSIGRNTY
jgi:hypothetical protein